MCLKRCAVISESVNARWPLTFQCLWSLRTVSCRPCCSSCGRMSVSSSHAFKNTLRSRWSSWLKKSCVAKVREARDQIKHLHPPTVMCLKMNTTGLVLQNVSSVAPQRLQFPSSSPELSSAPSPALAVIPRTSSSDSCWPPPAVSTPQPPSAKPERRDSRQWWL